MKSLVVGYGSIGQRHTRILRTMGFEVALVTSQSVDSLQRYSNLVEAIADWTPDYIVIAAPTSDHFDRLKEITTTSFAGVCLVEKPLFEKPRFLSSQQDFATGVGYNLRYLPVIQRLRTVLGNEEILSASFYNGEYLPNWRPNRDYRETSSASRAMGGGVLRDLSHEIDFIHYLLGNPKHVVAEVTTKGNLTIDTEDTVRAIFKHDSGCTTTLALSYLDQKRRREILITTSRESIFCNLLTGEIVFNDTKFRFPNDRDDTFVQMHNDVAKSEFKIACTMEQGLSVLDTIRMVERSSDEGGWVSR